MKSPDLNYYTILPASIRYNENVPDSDKVLMAEIILICSMYGHCLYDNNYFANLFGISERSIARRLSRLREHDFIEIKHIKLIKNNGRMEQVRVITLSKSTFD